MVGGIGLIGLGGCELLFIPAAGYSAFHSPDPLSKAYVLLRHNDCSAADAEFTEFLATKPDDPRAISGKADTMVCLGKYDDAIAGYSHAIELEPKWFDYLACGIAYKAKGDLANAIKNFDSGIAIKPEDPALYIYRGAVLAQQGNQSAARADFDKATSLFSNKPKMFNAYGWSLATSPISAYRDGPAAVEYATQACELTLWKNASVVDTLAAAYAEDGKFDDAVKWQVSAIELEGRTTSDDYEARLAMYRKREAYRGQYLSMLFY
jgi:Tfp pilus assembly protein PilF